MLRLKINEFHTLEVGCFTDVGRVRSENQDSWGRYPDDSLANDVGERLFIVADGMGGHADGRLASDTAVKTIGEIFYAQRTGGITARLDTSFRKANKNIFALLKNLPAGQIMGTTCTALVISGDRAFVGHVGDSRMYRFHKGTSKQVTNDHSLVAEMVRKGILTQAEAAHHPQRSMLERALGPEGNVEVDAYEIDRLRLHDIFVICSDGLGEVNINEISEILAAEPDPQKAAEHLVDLANQRGGMDNCTVQVVKVVKRDDADEQMAQMSQMPPSANEFVNSAPVVSYEKRTTNVQTGYFNALQSDEPPKITLPPAEPKAARSKKWMIPVGIIGVVGIIAAIVWYNMSLLNSPKPASTDEPFNEKAYMGDPEANTPLIGNQPVMPDTSGLQKGGKGNVGNSIGNGSVNNATLTPNPDTTLPDATVKKENGTNPTTPTAVSASAASPTTQNERTASSTPKPPDETPKISPLQTQLAEAKQKLNSGNYDEAVQLYLSLKGQNGDSDAVSDAIGQAASTLIGKGDASRNMPDKALSLYQKSQQLQDNGTVQKRIEDIKKLIDN
jgi:protein phosphatase